MKSGGGEDGHPAVGGPEGDVWGRRWRQEDNHLLMCQCVKEDVRGTG